nr:MAG TPA: S adenosylmethionine synthase [Caudoviricetes sp.]
MKFNEQEVLRTSEHISPSHPDKVCDLIAERLLAFTQKGNPGARFACDGAIKNNVLSLVGEVSQRLDKEEENEIILQTLEELGYGTDYCKEFNLTAYRKRNGWCINKTFTGQSENIARGVDSLGKTKASAGDIGIMFGYAAQEAPDLTFAPHWTAKRLLRDLYSQWKNSRGVTALRPDMKALVTIRYVGGVPVEVTKVTLCVSHASDSNVIPEVLRSAKITLSKIQNTTGWDTDSTIIQVNPTGAFSIYGPVADSGLVGRKIVCDQYGGAAPVGGGNLNGKDATKVDRSAVYMARYMAKSIVAEGLAHEAVVQLAYEIGRPNAVSVNVETDGTPFWRKRTLRNFVAKFDTSVQAIIDRFDLYNMSHAVHDECAMWGHIGDTSLHTHPDNSYMLPWERIK